MLTPSSPRYGAAATSLALLAILSAAPATPLAQTVARSGARVGGKSVAAAAARPPHVAVGSIAGHAYVNRANGASDILRGTEVQLYCADDALLGRLHAADSTLTALGRNATALLAQGSSSGENFFGTFGRRIGVTTVLSVTFPRVLEAYDRALRTTPLRTVRTTFEGAYRFDSLPAGRYLVVAKAESGDDVGYWREVATVAPGRPQTVDLGSFNLFGASQALALPSIKQSRDFVFETVQKMSRQGLATEARTALDGINAATAQAQQQPLPPAIASPITAGGRCQ